MRKDYRGQKVKAQDLLLSATDVQAALGPRVDIVSTTGGNPGSVVGDLIRSAATDSAFRSFAGRLDVDGHSSPVTASALVLVFDSTHKAERTFHEVGQAAHLRTEMEGCNVAVETVTSTTGLVSYWGFVQRNEVIIIVTLDTVEPHDISVADLRTLVIAAGHLLEAVTTSP